MDRLPSYPSIRAVGHKEVASLFAGPVLVEEKIDGSQFSFGVFDGELLMRSKGADVREGDGNKMFEAAIETVKSLRDIMRPGFVYRCEYLNKPKHNTLCYDRAPAKNLILFDVESPAVSDFYSYEGKVLEAEELGLEVVPRLFEGHIGSAEQLIDMLPEKSILGGNAEGLVVKNYDQFTHDGKIMIGKYVTDDFKEVHRGDWRERNPNKADIVSSLITAHRTPARWDKAIQHLRDAGTLEWSPRDIGPLLKEVQADIEKEEAEAIKDVLYAHFWPQIKRGVTAGMPEWYKAKLLESAFEEESDTEKVS